VGPRAGLDVLAKRRVPFFAGNLTLVVQPVAQSLSSSSSSSSKVYLEMQAKKSVSSGILSHDPLLSNPRPLKRSFTGLALTDSVMHGLP
jgi:hypothetical protein